MKKNIEDCVTVSMEQLSDHVWLCLEVIIICMLRLLTIQLEILLDLFHTSERCKSKLEKPITLMQQHI